MKKREAGHRWSIAGVVMTIGAMNPLVVSCAAMEAGTEKQAVRTTAYTHSERDHLKYGRKTAKGTTLRSGSVNSAAADWSVYPVGTKFKIAGIDRIYEIDDYGSALVGTETIDLYKPTRTAMNTWGVRHVDIEIVEVGCVETSIEILKGRKGYRHCRAMLEKLLERA
ncbi:MAG: 3D domain-containing protein [Verrucomicrobiota bacterium]